MWTKRAKEGRQDIGPRQKRAAAAEKKRHEKREPAGRTGRGSVSLSHREETKATQASSGPSNTTVSDRTNPGKAEGVERPSGVLLQSSLFIHQRIPGHLYTPG
ncbi:hypothetical protein CALCODRAFT_25533 [Calocera cornea HHB12733]|uniref:Uncharacterized protein n=1 Tax=Calocera cornea HHB12733 TaxID=1353952 RepID=A0A165J2M7_9BASI|nr:hypothetical protein CALCODRAFT_25533 [Calocera cornea HHB12733]